MCVSEYEIYGRDGRARTVSRSRVSSFEWSLRLISGRDARKPRHRSSGTTTVFTLHPEPCPAPQILDLDKILGFHDATRLATLHNSAMPGRLSREGVKGRTLRSRLKLSRLRDFATKSTWRFLAGGTSTSCGRRVCQPAIPPTGSPRPYKSSVSLGARRLPSSGAHSLSTRAQPPITLQPLSVSNDCSARPPSHAPQRAQLTS